MDLYYLFNLGQNYASYNCFGSFPELRDGKSGYRFAVWAPNARRVRLLGDFNNWQSDASWDLSFRADYGVWEAFFAGLDDWQRYKYEIQGADGQIQLKADPFARHQETRPGTASILYRETAYTWHDAEFLAQRRQARDPGPLNIYEMHFASWRRHEDGSPYNYRDLAPLLVPYLQDMGYNAVEMMPLAEHPLDDSWGYQTTGYFSVTSRFGLPEDFKFLVDSLHQAGIRVIMDWVPAHFPKDAWALARFDGTPLYEYSDPRLRERESWGTLVFDFAKKEVQSFLISSAWFWIRDCHVDGLRVDAVSSMLYLTYDRPHDDLVRERGGRINQDAVAFLRKLNGLMAEEEPQVLMIAEEATSYEGVSHPVEEGGLGFTHKWNMGWMNDILAYMQTDYLWRGDHYHQLTFSLTYAFSENFILPISHDEVVHGKRSLLDKMPGDIWRKFASLRSFLMYQMAHPGAKLNFMGYELGMFIEWRFREELEWFLLDYESHRQLHHFVSVLNHLYLSESCLSEALPAWEGFIWNQVQDSDNSVIAFTRVDRQGRKVLCIFNLTPVPLEHYRLSVLDYGRYRMILNSDDRAFYGSAYLGDATEGRSYLTQPATLQAKEEQMRALEAEDRAFAQLLNQRREQLLGEAKAYAEAVQERVSDGRVSREDGERLTAAIRRLTDLPAPAVRAPEIRCHLELTLPPLAALYLLYEGVPDSGSADDGKRAPVRRRAARRTAEKP